MLVHTEWCYNALAKAGRTDLCNADAVRAGIDLQGTVSALCRRSVELPWQSFVVADSHDLEFDKVRLFV